MRVPYPMLLSSSSVALVENLDGLVKLLVKSTVCNSYHICCVWWELSGLAKGLDVLASQGKEQ